MSYCEIFRQVFQQHYLQLQYLFEKIYKKKIENKEMNSTISALDDIVAFADLYVAQLLGIICDIPAITGPSAATVREASTVSVSKKNQMEQYFGQRGRNLGGCVQFKK